MADLESVSGYGDNWDEERETVGSALKLAGFYVGPGLYGIDIMRIKEVVQSTPYRVRPVPHAPRIVQGVITLRGVVLPVIDLRELFSAHDETADARLNKLIIVSVGGRIVALKVDRVIGELRVPADEVRPAPSMLSEGGQEEYFSGVCNIGDDVVFVVNVDGLVGGPA